MSSLLVNNYGRRVLLENLQGSFTKTVKFQQTLESAQSANQIDSVMAKKLLDTIADKKYTDFGPITDSQGDITRFKGYQNMVETLNIIKGMEPSNDTPVTAKKEPSKADEVLQAISVIETHKNNFIRGFLINNELLKMTYNTMIFACLDATSVLADDMVAYIRDISVANSGIRNANHRYTSFNQVRSIVDSDKSGDLNKLFNSVLDSKNNANKDNFIGPGAMSTMLAVGAVLAIVPLIREVIYIYYQSRVSVDDYLNHQKLLIELNQGNISNSNLKAGEKKEIIKKQEAYLKKIDRVSEKIRIQHEQGSKKAENLIKKENKTWTLDSIEDSQSDFMIL